jgi:hypothetical protein
MVVEGKACVCIESPLNEPAEIYSFPFDLKVSFMEFSTANFISTMDGTWERSCSRQLSKLLYHFAMPVCLPSNRKVNIFRLLSEEPEITPFVSTEFTQRLLSHSRDKYVCNIHTL